MFYPVFVCSSLCLFVCLSFSNFTTLTGSSVKILSEKYLEIKKNGLNFRSHPRLDPDPGIFKGFFSIARGIFPQFGSHLWKN